MTLGSQTLTIANGSTSYAGIIGGTGGLTLTAGTETLSGTNTYTGVTTINGGTLQIGAGGTTGSVTGNIVDNAALVFNRSNALTYSETISGTGSVTQAGAGTLTLSGTNTYTGATTINGGTLALSGTGSIAASSQVNLTNAGSTFDISSSSAGATITTLNGVANSNVTLGARTLTISNGSTTYAGIIGGTGGLTLTAGTETLSGTNIYTGVTTINGGTLVVNGSIASSTLTTVANGATLIGTGTVGSAQINSGGTFAPGIPGSSMFVSGNLALQSGAIYLVQVYPTSASMATVSGAATLAGSVQASFAPGSYVQKQYDILHSGGLSGTTFATLTTTNLPPGFVASLSYTPTDVLLNLIATLGISTSGLNTNQQNVANSLNNYFNGGGKLPSNFASIFFLTGGSLANALTQLDGEAATGAERAVFQLSTEFLDLMLDPFVNGRGNAGLGGSAIGFAPDQDASLPPDIALAYSSILKAPPKPTFDQRWMAWGAAYGGSNNANGNAAVGSSNITAHTYGFAGGMDYRFTPDTLVGFALAGAGTNWGLRQGARQRQKRCLPGRHSTAPAGSAPPTSRARWPSPITG